MSPMGVLHENDWYRLTVVTPGSLRLDRSPEHFTNDSDMAHALEPLFEVLVRAQPRALLIDLRHAPARNDAAFEESFAPYRRRMCIIAKDTALLLRSMVGQLQVKRLATEDGAVVKVFHDEGEAIRWLRAGRTSGAPSAG